MDGAIADCRLLPAGMQRLSGLGAPDAAAARLFTAISPADNSGSTAGQGASTASAATAAAAPAAATSAAVAAAATLKRRQVKGPYRKSLLDDRVVDFAERLFAAGLEEEEEEEEAQQQGGSDAAGVAASGSTAAPAALPPGPDSQAAAAREDDAAAQAAREALAATQRPRKARAKRLEETVGKQRKVGRGSSRLLHLFPAGTDPRHPIPTLPSPSLPAHPVVRGLAAVAHRAPARLLRRRCGAGLGWGDGGGAGGVCVQGAEGLAPRA